MVPDRHASAVANDWPAFKHTGFPELYAAAYDVPATPGEGALPHIWRRLLQGTLRVDYAAGDYECVLVDDGAQNGRVPLCEGDARMLTRVLRGDSQKAVAADLGIASSTCSGRYLRAVAALGLTPCRIPLAIVLAAQSIPGVRPTARVAVAFVGEATDIQARLTVPRPAVARMTELTAAEHAVAHCIMVGCSRVEIAHRRATSVHTVARQVHSVFQKMNVTGRFALVQRAVDLDAF
jgi:DNA-binding CsgD family transcriptional regulator